jgi:2-polyprenyl-3-methyl-5-hydroxy-6-metoxy-1,4-benzoquinol methylase
MPEQQSSRGIVRRLVRPFTRPLDGRVADINRRVTDVRLSITALGESVDVLTRELGAYATTATESNAYVGVEMRRLQESLDALRAHIDEHEGRVLKRVDALEDKSYVERLNHAVDAPLERLDGAVANLLNRAAGHEGFAAQAGLWFNPSVTVELTEGHARLAGVNERIVEMPFALAALGRLKAPARILEVGSAESTFALSAASLGHQVTALDLHSLSYSHPNIANVIGRFEDWDPGAERFDAVFLISTIEHFGLGAYGEPVAGNDADRAAIARVAELLTDDGFMVLTTPYGPARIDDLERVYDEKALTALLKGWTVIHRHTVLRWDERTWLPEVPGGTSPTDKEQGVVMVVAVPARPA